MKRPLLAPCLIAAALALPLALSCTDPSSPNLPAPRELNAQQTAKVQPHLLKAMPENVTFPADVSMGGGTIHYLGTDVLTGKGLDVKVLPGTPVEVRRGETVRLRHYFRADKKPDGSWKIFIHGADAAARRNFINADHYPVYGLWPTVRWEPGMVVEDVHDVRIPESAPDTLSGWLGLYRLDTRMKVDEAKQHDGKNRIRAFGLSVTGEAAPLPTYQAQRRSAPITIDGSLDDPGWKGVKSTGAFVKSLSGKKAKYKTKAKLVWDDEYLYAAFIVEDPDVWGSFEKRDDPIYQEEVVEIFIDADGDGKTYNELELSPRGVIFDAYFPERRKRMDLSWNSGIEAAARVRGTLNDASDKDDGWDAEMRIPVAKLASVPRWPPQKGDKWRFNLYRLDWHSNREKNEGQAFSPLFVGDFHHLPRFGWLEFAGQDEAPSAPEKQEQPQEPQKTESAPRASEAASPAAPAPVAESPDAPAAPPEAPDPSGSSAEAPSENPANP